MKKVIDSISVNITVNLDKLTPLLELAKQQKEALEDTLKKICEFKIDVCVGG